MICRRRSRPRRPATNSCSTSNGSTTMEEFFRRRSRVMSPNNRKQAMLPSRSEILDNPIGTACGFAIDIGKARFFFTPGVPRELRRMLEEQIIPRLLAQSGMQTAIRLKRFHSYGLGESHVDHLLQGVEELVPDGSAKLGFRAHYPQIETKLTVRGSDDDDIERKLVPVVAEVRKRLGNFIMAEDNDTLEGVVLKALRDSGGSLAIVETFTSGQIAARIAPSARRRDRVPPRHRRARSGRIVGRAAAGDAGRDHPRERRGGGAGRPPRQRREPRARRADRSRRRPGPDRFRRHDLPRDRDRDRRSTRAARAFSAGANGCASAPSNSASTACAASSTACRSPSASISSGPDIAVSLCATEGRRLILRHPGESRDPLIDRFGALNHGSRPSPG